MVVLLYPFTPRTTMPWMEHFCTMKNRAMIGISVIIVIAQIDSIAWLL